MKKVAIVTGAKGGIGSEVVLKFWDMGIKVIMLDKVLGHDLTDIEQTSKLIDDIIFFEGRIDILVNCIGINIRKPIDQYLEEDWNKIMDTNLKSIFFLTNKVAKVMKKQKHGKIVNVSSIQANTCFDANGKFSLLPYGVSKAGLVLMTKSFALELARYNITVNAVLPAFVDTELVRVLKENKKYNKYILSKTPMKRFAKPSEIADAIVFLSTDQSSYITGHSLLVDGGWSI